MMTRLVLASILALGCTSSADTRRPAPTPVPSTVIFSVDKHLEAELQLPDVHFELRADGTWSYVETLHQAITKRGNGKLAGSQVAAIRSQLAAAKWQVTTSDAPCVTFGVETSRYAVDGTLVWTDKTCSGKSLDQKSAKQLEQVMASVRPLMK